MSSNFVRNYVDSRLQNLKTNSLAVEGNAYIRGVTNLNEVQIDQLQSEGSIALDDTGSAPVDNVDLHIRKGGALTAWLQADAVDDAGADEDTDLIRVLLSHNKESSLLELTSEDGTSTYNLLMGDSSSGLAGSLNLYTRQVDNSGDIPGFDPITGKLILTANDRGLFVNDQVEVDGDVLLNDGSYRIVEGTIANPVYRNCDIHVQKDEYACIYLESDQDNFKESDVPVFLSTADGGVYGYEISMDGSGNQVTFTSGSKLNTTLGNFNFYSAQLTDPGAPDLPEFDKLTRRHLFRITLNSIRGYGYFADFTATAGMGNSGVTNVTGLNKVDGESAISIVGDRIRFIGGTYIIRLRTDNTGSASTTLQVDMYKSIAGVSYGAERRTAVARAGYTGFLEVQWNVYFNRLTDIEFEASDDTVDIKNVEIYVLRQLGVPLFPS